MLKANKWIILVVALVVIGLLILLVFRICAAPEVTYTVTSQRWQEAFGDEDHILTIYRNVTIEIYKDATQDRMILATANGSLMLDNQAQNMKLVCISSDNAFTTYIYRYASKEWSQYDGKTDVVDDCLNTYLPSYVDMAMEGLQDEFEAASYDEDEKCYVISQSAASGEQSGVIYCRVYFEDGHLVRLETEIVSQGTKQTLKLYNIGKTQVNTPVENE